MLRFARTSTRPLFRSLLARPSPVAHLPPYNSSPCLRSFHPGDTLQYAKKSPVDEQLGAIENNTKNNVAVKPEDREAGGSTEEHDLAPKKKPRIRESEAALKLKAEIKEQKKQERVAKKHEAYLKLMKKKETKKYEERVAKRGEKEKEETALKVEADEILDEKKEKATFQAKSKPRYTRVSEKSAGGNSRKTGQSSPETGIDNDTGKKSFPASYGAGVVEVEPVIEELPVGEVYRSEEEFLQSIGVSVPEKKPMGRPGRKPKNASVPRGLPIVEVEAKDNDTIHEAPNISEEDPSEHDVKSAKLKSLPKVSKPFKIKFSKETKNVAQQLDQVWQSTNPETGRRSKSQPRKRINIVSHELCDDIIERMKPSLSKHVGCDILDLNPGSCVWSSKLHEFLKPRTHVLMEQDMDVYDPYIQPLLDAPESTYKLCAKSGLIWGDLETVMNKDFFPFQEALPKDDPRLNEPNDSMLVLVNLAHHPKQGYKGFPNISPLVMFQLMAAIGSHALFQRYGLVRMLVWISDDEREAILPRHVTFRRRMTVENELTCALTEVTSSTLPPPAFRRDAAIDISATRKVLDKMTKRGIKTPRGRESIIQQHILDNPDNAEEVGEVLELDKKSFRYVHELAELEAKVAAGEADATASNAILRSSPKSNDKLRDMTRMKILYNRQQFRDARKQLIDGFVSRHRSIYNEQGALYGVEGEEAHRRREELKELRLELDHEIEGQVAKETRNKAKTTIDNARAMYTENHPIFQYDRREFEPLRNYKEEFYPSNTELALLDLTPNAIWPVFQKDFPKNLDIFQHILGAMFHLPTQGVKQALLSLWPGAYEYLIQECPSLMNVKVGGDPDLDMIPVRLLPMQCFREIIEAWDRWPFKPTREELLVHGSMWESEQDQERALGKSG